eukprot:TRINITY_DN1378_c0_g1_i1.p1 TRINITY_DN1378_c0_g1~~TRINITY_DN1378_c0_g1_i1.p1  ORF type:complete len:3355 (-),score=763.88 TRINITY_DN1378_c0_g1_i1:110-10174(-)
MLESIVSSLLTKYLGDYVEGLDTNNLNIGITKGDVVLANLRLKKSALDGLELPVVIKEGFLGKLSLQIPWRDLSSKPVVVRIERVYLLVQPKPKSSDAQTLDDIIKLEKLNKQRRLQIAEVLGLDAAPDEDDATKQKRLQQQDKKAEDGGFFARLANKIVDNLQIFIDKIHVRYEDAYSNPEKPFVFGVTLDGLHAQSCDADWNATFLSVGDTIMRKLVDLRNLAIYWNTAVGASNTKFVSYESIDQMAAALDSLIYSGADNSESCDHAFLLRPISGRLRARVDKSDAINMESPKIQLDLEVEEVGLGLNSGQYRRMLDLVDLFTLYSRNLPYLKFRPPTGTTPSKNPRAWWNYAIEAVRNDVRQKNERWTWEWIHQRKVDRNQYLEVFKKKQLQGEKKLSTAEKDSLAELESRLSYDDIILYRKLANAAVQREKKLEKERLAAEKAAGGGGVTGWISSWWGGGKPQTPTKAPTGEQDKPSLSKEEEQALAMKEIYSAIGFDETAASSAAKEPILPKEYVKTSIEFKMKRALVELTEETGKRARLLVLNLNSFSVTTLMREGSMSVKGALDSIVALEYHTLGGKELTAITSSNMTQSTNSSSIEKFMRLQFDMNPIDTPADQPLDLRMNLQSLPIAITFSKSLIDRVAVFFSTEGSATGYQQISSVAYNGFDTLRQRAQDSIKYSLEQKKKLAINLDLQAPRIYMPQRFTETESVSSLVVDLGSLKFSSNPYAVTASADNVSEDFFYDHYSVCISGVNAGIITTDPGSSSSSSSQPQLLGLGDIVRKFDLNLDLKLLTAATPELPKVKLAANLPDLHLDVTRDKIVRLLDILKSLSPPAPATKEVEAAPKSTAKPTTDSRPASSAIPGVAVPDPRKSIRQPDIVKSWTSSSARAISTMIPVENQKKEPDQKAVDPVVTKVASVEFQLQRLVVSLGLENIEENKGIQPLVDIRLFGAGMSFSNSSVDMKVGLTLRGFEIVDKMFPGESTDRRQRFIICSRTSEDDVSGSSLVAVEYLGVPKDSPSYQRVDHRITVQFGYLDFNVNRLSIALLLQVLTSLSATGEAAPPPSSEIQLPTPAIASKAQEELVIQKEELLAEAKHEEIEHPPETFDFSLAKIDVTLRGISLNLNKDGVTFLCAELAGTTAHVDARGDTTLFVDGSVESLTVTESNVSDPALSKIVSIGGEKMLTFTYETFSKANSHAAIAYPGYDMSVRVRLGSIRAVFVNRLVKELGSYFGAFAQMREVTAAAASYYYTQSKEAVKAASSAVKLHLDIVIGNPYVVVPSTSDSAEEQLILDLGRISIKNKFDRVDPHRVIVDDMKVSVESFNLRTEKRGTVTPIIGKTDLIVGLRRAVERNERHWVPDLELAVGISAISVSICEAQVSQIMKTLQLNVAGQPTRRDEVEMKKIAELLSGSSFNVDSWRDAQSKIQASAVPQAASAAAEGEAFIYMKLKLKLAQVAFALSEGNGVGSDGRHTSVVQLAMNDMALLLDMRSDSALQMKFTLREIVAEDTRLRTNNQFRRLLSKAARSEQVDDVDQIAVEYGTTPATQRTDIKVLLNYPRISIIPDSLAYIYKFSMSVTNSTLKELAEFQKLSGTQEAQKSPDQEEAKVEPAQQQGIASPIVSSMVAAVIIKSPEIAVVEDSFSPSTPAFIMHLGDSTVRYIQTGDGQQKIDLHLEKFDLSKCILAADPTRPAQDVTLLLQPFTIGFNMSSSPSDENDLSSLKRSRMAVEIGLLKTILSYRDMRLGLTIWKSFQVLLAEFQAKPAADSAAGVAPSSSDQAVVSAEPQMASSVVADDSSEEPSLNMIVTLQGLSFSMLDDKIDPAFSTPVLKFWIDAIQTTIRMWPSQEMILTTSFDTVELDAYNNELASHEPVIEPWRLSMEYHQTKDFKSIHVEADEMLDINVTKSLLDATLNGLELFRDLTSDKDVSSSTTPMSSGSTRSKKEAEKRLSFNPYIIRNSLSRPIRYWISGRSEAEFGHTLQAGQEEPLLIRETRENAAEQPIRYEIDVRILDDQSQYQLQQRIPISKVQSVVRKVHANFADVSLVAAIEYQNGSKIVTLRSDHTITNSTDFDLEITVDSARNGVKEFSLPPLSPGASTAVPIDGADFSSLKVRPVGNYTFFCIARNEKSGVVTCSADPRNEELAPSWMCTFKSKTIETPDGNHDTAIIFHPSIVLENALPTGLSIQLLASDSVVWQKDFVAKTAEVEFYEASKPIRISDLAISVQTPGFGWSKRAPFAKKIGGDPIRLAMKDPSGRSLKLSADVKKNDCGTIIVSVFCPYIIVNQSGLRLAYKKDSGEKEAAAGQAFADSSARDLEDDQNQWYSADEQSKLSIDFASSVDYGYAKNRFMYGEKTLSLRVENSVWSKSFPLGVQNQGVILISDEKVSGRLYQFAVVVASAPGRLWRTKVVRIYPHIIMVNKTSRGLFWKQEAREKAASQVPPSQHVASDVQLPLHWPSASHEKRISVSLDGDRTAAQMRWSPSFDLNSIDSFQLKLRRAGASSDYEIIQVSIRISGGSTFVVFTDGVLHKDIRLCADYRVDNNSSVAIAVTQTGADADISAPLRVEPRSSGKFCWDNPQAKEPEVEVSIVDATEKTARLSLDVITSELKPLSTRSGSVKFSVIADGSTKVLIVEDYDKKLEKEDRKMKEKEDQQSGSEVEEIVDEAERKATMEINLSMKGFGLSLIDDRPQELLYLTMQTVSVKITQSNIDQGIELIIGQGQIDNQLYLSPLPIILYAHPNENGAPFVHISMVRDTRHSSIQLYKYFAVSMQEIDISVDQPFLFRMLSYVNFVSRAMLSRSTAEAEAALLNDSGSANADPMPSLSNDELKVSDMFYFELFHLNPIRANITFLPLPNPDRLEGEDEDDESVIERVLGYVGALASIERAPLELNGLMLEHPFTTQRDLVSRITQHYTMAALRQAYLLVGSADFLGNPVSLVSNLGTGVRDFFYEPAQGIVKSPQDFGRGLAKGTASLVKKSTYALFDTASKLTGTVAKVGATLTMDDDYKRERAARSAVQAKHAGEGLMYGFRDFGIGLYKGVTGVVLEPIKGAKKDGALGFVKGVGRGMAGVVLKPVVGAVDIVTRTTEGIKNTTRYFDEKRKAPIRPPRYISSDKLISVYDLEKSLGQQILRTVDKPKLRREAYVFHMFLKDKNGKDDDIVVATRLGIIFITSQIIQATSGFHVEWREPIRNIKEIELVQGAILLVKKGGKDPQKESARKLPFHNPADGVELLRKFSSTALGLKVRAKAGQEKRDDALSGSSSSNDVVVQIPSSSSSRERYSTSDIDEEAALHGDQDPLLAQRNLSQKKRETKANNKRKGNKISEKSPLLAHSDDAEDSEDSSCCSCCCVQ